MQRRIAVIGGGVAGCVFAAEVAKRSPFQVDLYEAAERLGGLHHSPVIDGVPYDIGAFFFEPNHQLFTTFPDLKRAFVPFPVKITAVSDRGNLDSYPLTLKGYIRNNGLPHLAKALIDLAYCKARHCRAQTLPGYMRYYIGSSIYERSGLKHYIERLFSMPDAEVDISFAMKRMKNLPRWASLRRIARRVATQPARLARGEYFPPSSLARPRGGFPEAYGLIEAELKRLGINVRKGARIERIERRAGGHDVTVGGQRIHYDVVASTAPLPVTARLCGVPTEHRFDTVSLLSVFWRFRGEPGFDAAVLSNFSHGGQWKRIVNLSYIYGEQGGWQHFVAEIPLPPGGNPEGRQAELKSHLQGLGLFAGEFDFQGEVITRNAYPIYRADSLDTLAADKQRLADYGIVLAGRQGEFEYFSSSEAAAISARKAQEVAASLSWLYTAAAA